MDKLMTDRQKALESTMGQIDKQFGKGSVMKMGERPHMDMEAISTGALSLDLALGIGGVPKGRVVEIYGPESSGKTTLAMHVVAEAQRMGGICAYIDAEHAVDPLYARQIGVDVDELLISQPDTGEQALEITDMLVRSGAIDVVVIDSVAALTPKAEIEGEMGDTHVGLQARLMSQALRKLTANINRTNTVVIFINQLREKIGVMFGCLSGDSRVLLADGSLRRIDQIVRHRMPVEVLSYDAKLGRVVPKKIVNWFDNGPTENFLNITVPRIGGSGVQGFSCTSNHQIMTPGGWREAGELQVGDRVLRTLPHYLSDFQWEVVLGSLMGDGALSPNANGLAARFRFGHGAKQAAYCDWKASLFSNVTVSHTRNAKEAEFWDVQPLAELAGLREAVYTSEGKVFSHDYLKQLTPLSLALWYMDDGGFSSRSKGLQERTRDGSGRSEICVQAMEPTTRARLVQYLADTWDLHPRLAMRGSRQMPVLVFPKDETAKLHALIAPFVHPSMEYKLLPRFRGKFSVEPVFAPSRDELVPLPITGIRAKKVSPATSHRFDIEVEGSHNYFANGVMVHNSPETTPGGRALKFYSSVRLDIRRIESIKEGVEVVGNRTRVKVVKNKCIAEGTEIFDPTTGLTHHIEDIVERGVGSHVVGYTPWGEGLVAREITDRFDQGIQEVVGIEMDNGQTLWATPDHPMAVCVGQQLEWHPLGEIAPGAQLFGSNGWPADARPWRATAAAAAGGSGVALLEADTLQPSCLVTVTRKLGTRYARTYDLGVAEVHNFVANGVVVHNCSAPFRQAEFDIMYGKGISREGSVLDVAVDLGIVKKSGAWYTYEGEQLGQGRENAKTFLAENAPVMIEIYDRVRQQVGLDAAPDGLDTPLGHGETDPDDEPITLD